METNIRILKKQNNENYTDKNQKYTPDTDKKQKSTFDTDKKQNFGKNNDDNDNKEKPGNDNINNQKLDQDQKIEIKQNIKQVPQIIIGQNPNHRPDFLKIFQSFQADGHITKVEKVLGSGAFGEVRDIKVKNKTMAGKVVTMKIDEKSGEYIAYELHGQNIIKISKIVQKCIDDRNYYLIIMEKAILRDLGKLSDYYNCHNLLKLIYKPFHEQVGNNMLRYYARQIVNAMELLNRSNFVHFDIKPENLLISYGVTIKLSDFSLLKQIEDRERLKIPGGTNGYVTLEYYNKNEKISGVDARKQDYFAFGATLFFLKYGIQMLKYKTDADNDANKITIINGLIKQISEIRSGILTDKDFIDFILPLIGFKPNDRPNFDQIYRNKWLNKNVEQLHQIFWAFEYDEEKLIMELQKNDFLIEKEKIINKKPCRFRFKKRI